MIVDNGKYYVYRHVRLDTNEVFYIGIGSKLTRVNGKSMYQRAFSKSERSSFWKSVANKTKYEVEILLESDNYEFIQSKEVEFIKMYGKRSTNEGTLCNLTDGGEGTSGRRYYTTEEMLEKFRRIHGNKYDYSKFIYNGFLKKSIIMCEKHGEFLQTPENHLKSRGCQRCGNESRIRRDSKINNYAKIFVDKLKCIYQDRFDYSLVEYTGQRNKVKLICSLHGEFTQIPADLLSGHNCQKCGRSSISKSKRRGSPEQVKDIQQQLLAGKSVLEISKQTGLSKDIISYIKNHGYKE